MGGTRMDSLDITPEELVEAIKQYKEAHGGTAPAGAADGGAAPPDVPGKGTAAAEGGQAPDGVAPVPPVAEEPPSAEPKKDAADLPTLITAVEQLLAALKGGGNTDGGDGGASCGTGQGGDSGNQADANTDGSGDMSKSLNADSADDLFRQRLGICRVGDKLGIEGLEGLSILDGKKAVIAKVLPDMRLDGKDTAYIDAAYDIAVGAAGKRKDVSYQRQQMASGTPPTGSMRNDGAGGGSMASAARQRMIDGEGGRE